MEFPILIIWTSPNSGDPDQTPYFAVSDLDLYYLHLSNKKDASLIWVKEQQTIDDWNNILLIYFNNDLSHVSARSLSLIFF